MNKTLIEPNTSTALSSGEHRKVAMYGGSIEVCDTCINSLGYNVTWGQAHPAAAVTDA